MTSVLKAHKKFLRKLETQEKLFQDDGWLDKIIKELKQSEIDYNVRHLIKSDISREGSKLEAEMDIAASVISNGTYNKLQNFIPYDHNRVKITPTEDNPDGYINGSHVFFKSTNSRFIIAAAPSELRVDRFWRMVMEQKSRVIIMLVKFVVDGFLESYRYLPEEENKILQFGDFQITCQKFEDHEVFVHRFLRVTNIKSGEEHKLEHFQYLKWRKEFTFNCEEFDKFYSFVHALNILRPPVSVNGCFPFRSKTVAPEGPPIIHCLAGIGRSGTFLTIDMLLEKFRRGMKSSDDILGMIPKLRTQRRGSVKHPTQLQFICEYLIFKMKQMISQSERVHTKTISPST